ncbi:hypothetical protein BLEM_1077 [Bifidobacterium lemurum]|uniref:Antitoxin VbhA domain-containing protein n=1 Tax=Bifidobacterium lemurum TaxID=1603886 RepID=A0A261FTK6_9BIFI|nr:antitoxin VbhA family protein [Bifidobacterium lemurum]OZG62531.1 hypothetical protein BLEM_1077 [Bifidobacterium lemurum]QOL33867.1 antitoxin VbhA family protein [Bifidobacterium lemurum]
MTVDEARRRAENLSLAVHSSEMEGGMVSSEFLRDAKDYVNGLIDEDGLVARTRARYGLTSV